jgi:hypothetical protein
MAGFNGGGVWIAPNQVAPGTVILSSVYNDLQGLIKTSFDNTVTRDGQGAMTGPFKLIDGTAAIPAFSFNAESSTGLYRPSTGVLALTVQGTQAMAVTNAGVTINGTSTHTGASTFSSSLGVSGATGLNTMSVAGSATFASGLLIPAANGGMEIGSTSASNTPFIDFHSNGTSHDFDVRLIASGGTTTDGQGTLTINAGNLVLGIVTSAGSASFAGGVTAPTFTGTASKASTLSQGGGAGAAMTFNWLGQVGQPNWLWGGTDGINHYVYNPSNFSVNYAATAGNVSSISSAVGASYTWTGQQSFVSGGSAVGVAGSSGVCMPQSPSSGTAASISFHRPGAYGLNMGLDADNVFRIGGWSDGASTYRLQIDTTGGVYANRLYFGNSNHIKANTGPYGSAELTGTGGTTGGYSGIYLSGGAGTVIGMRDAGGSGGEWSATEGWMTYWNTSNHCLGIGGSLTNASYKAYTNGNHFVGGQLVASGDVTAFSDARIKKDVSTITDALLKVEEVRGVMYTRIDTGERGTGVIAQELEAVLPEAVREDSTGTKSVAYGNVIGLLIEAIKELHSKIKTLEAA